MATTERRISEHINAAISRILGAALSGLEPKYQSEQFIRWGIVEKDMHEAVNAALQPDDHYTCDAAGCATCQHRDVCDDEENTAVREPEEPMFEDCASVTSCSYLAAAQPDEDEPIGCPGHPAGPNDPMGQTVYCDGSCRR